MNVFLRNVDGSGRRYFGTVDTIRNVEILVQTITESRMNEKKVSSARYQFIDDPVDSHDEVGPAGIEIIYELVK